MRVIILVVSFLINKNSPLLTDIHIHLGGDMNLFVQQWSVPLVVETYFV